MFAALCLPSSDEPLKNLLLYFGAFVFGAGGLYLTYDLFASVIRGRIDIGGNFKSATWSESKLYFLRLVIFKICVALIAFTYMGVCLQYLNFI